MRCLVWFGAGLAGVVIFAALLEAGARGVAALHCLFEDPSHRTPDCVPVVAAFCSTDTGAAPLALALVVGAVAIARELARRRNGS